MSVELWSLEQSQIKALKHAELHALFICEWAGKLFRGISENRNGWGHYGIENFLDSRNGFRVPEALQTVGFLIEPVGIPVVLPWLPRARGVPVKTSHKSPTAHRVARLLWDTLHGFLFHRTAELCPELGLILDPSLAANKMVSSHWDTLRSDLAEVAQFNCKELEDSIKRESHAAIENCNAKIISGSAGLSAAESDKPPMLTEPLTKTELGTYFTCHRNNVQKDILDKYEHETVGNKYRMHVTDMPPAYLLKHK